MRIEEKSVRMKLDREKSKAVFVVFLFILSILPILYLVQYVHATGDDYGYGVLTHAAWLESHSLTEVLKASFKTIHKYYIGWQGTWFSIFLFTLQPEVFSPHAYWIVPILMLSLIIIGTTVLVHYFLVRKIGMRKSSFIIIDCLILFLMIQYFPSTKSGIFWYNGAAHYVVPYFLAMLSVYYFIHFIDSYRKRYLAGAVVCMTLLGGASYLAALFAPIVLVLLLLYYARKRTGTFWLLIPLGMELIGLVISFAAPGNKVRGGEDFGFSVSRAFFTIGESFRQGILNIGTYIKEKPTIFLIFLLIAIVVWNAAQNIQLKNLFRWPALFCILMFCIYCSMFAPGIYAGTELSGGVPNMIYQIFILTMVAGIIYLLFWLSNKIESSLSNSALVKKKIKSGIFIAAFGCAVLILLWGRSTLRQTTFYKCISYITSGQASDYGEQMEERLAILLDDTVKDAQLPAMNQDQGPLMHMEVTKDINGWTNQVVRDFYGKNSVVEIDRGNN